MFSHLVGPVDAAELQCAEVSIAAVFIHLVVCMLSVIPRAAFSDV